MDDVTLLEAAGSAAVSILGLALAWLSTWAAKKVRLQYSAGVLGRLSATAETAVQSVWQTYVEALKTANADGKLEAEEKARAKKLALDELKSYLGAKGLGEIVKVLGVGSGEVDKVLSSALEAAIAREKKGGLAAVVANP
jgi:ABC-type taurine transport system substrate-binding protein